MSVEEGLTRTMRIRELQGVSNDLVRMIVAWPVREDLETCAELPDGAIELNLLTGTCTHSDQGPVRLRSCTLLRWWLRSRLRALGIPKTGIVIANVTATFRTDRIKTRRSKIVSFDWVASAEVGTSERTFHGKPAERHLWYTRTGDGAFASAG